MPSVPPQVTYLLLSQFKLMTELLCSLLFITRQLSLKIQPATPLCEFFHCTSQRFSLVLFPRRMNRPLPNPPDLLSQIERQKLMFSEQPISVPTFLRDYIPPPLSLTTP